MTDARYLPGPSTIVVAMGVSGCGKSTIGRRLADSLGFRFLDADGFHPDSNVQKVSQGNALCDRGRVPWLQRLHAIRVSCAARGDNVVLACYALRRRYRELLRTDLLDGVRFGFLHGDLDLIRDRLRARRGTLPLSYPADRACLSGPRYCA